jgi:Leucine-rich repeat (LRR) protein
MLVEFNIASNQLQGTIQSNAFENLTSLSTLDLSDNRFTGSFPNVSFLYNLNYLNLSYNKFTELSQLSEILSNKLPTNLTVLDISGLNIIGAPFPIGTTFRSMLFEQL